MRTETKLSEERDKEIILYIYHRGAAKKKQIYKMFFSHQVSGQQNCRRVLNRLTTYHYLKRDSNKFYSTGEKSLSLIRKFHGIVEIKSIKPTSHLEEINDFQDTLILACRNSDFILEDFKTYYNHREQIKDTVDCIHIPDLVFELSKNNKYYLCFGEIDRGTEHPNKYLKMIKWYLNYFSSGLFRYKYNFNIAFCLIIVPSIERLNNMRKNATRLVETRQIELLNRYELDLAKHFLRFIWITLKDNIKPELIFTDIWQSLLETDQDKYGIY
ncbi:MAG: replication-relaxation family protein [Candidatus Hodarchaeota archaeon]